MKVFDQSTNPLGYKETSGNYQYDDQVRIQMFFEAKLSVPNYDSLLIGWDRLALQSGVNFHGGSGIYYAGGAARADMISSDGWSITDDQHT